MTMPIDWKYTLYSAGQLASAIYFFYDRYESRCQATYLLFSLRIPEHIWGVWRCLCHVLTKKFLTIYRWLCIHRRRQMKIPYAQSHINDSLLYDNGSSFDSNHSNDRPSSGRSSPQSLVDSVTISSRTSSAALTPPSTQSSIADLSSLSPLPFFRPQPRIRVSSLLADPHTRSYHLEIVQQPLLTAEFGMAYLSRVPLSPPIIARLIVRDPSGNSVIPESELPFLIAHLSLLSEDGLTALDTGSFIGGGGTSEPETPPPLYGHLVSTVEQLEDLQGNMGLFFLFPDVSIRTRGHYRLGVTLTRITSPDPFGIVEHGTPLAQENTRPFEAVPVEEYTAVPTTRLTQSFIRQGARMFTNTPMPARHNIF